MKYNRMGGPNKRVDVLDKFRKVRHNLIFRLFLVYTTLGPDGMRKVQKPNIDDFLNFLRDEQPPPPPPEGNGNDVDELFPQEDIEEDPLPRTPPSPDGEVRISPMTTTGNLLRFDSAIPNEEDSVGLSSPFPITKASRRYDNDDSSSDEEDGEEGGGSDEVEVELVSPDMRRRRRSREYREEENEKPPTFHIPLVPSRNRKREDYDEVEGNEERKQHLRDPISNLLSSQRKQQRTHTRPSSVNNTNPNDSELSEEEGSHRSKFTREEYEDEIIRLRKLVDDFKIRLSGVELELREYKSNSLHEGIFSEISNFHKLNAMIHDSPSEQVGLPPFPKFFKEVQNEGSRIVNFISRVVIPLIDMFVRRRDELNHGLQMIKESVEENYAKMERSKKLKEEANRYRRVFRRFRLLTRKIHEVQEYLDMYEFENVLGGGFNINHHNDKSNKNSNNNNNSNRKKKKKKGILSRNIRKLEGEEEGKEPTEEQLKQILRKLMEEKKKVKNELLRIREEVVYSSSKHAKKGEMMKGNDDVFPISSFSFDDEDDDDYHNKKNSSAKKKRRRRRRRDSGDEDYDDFDFGDGEDDEEEEELKSPKISIVIEDRSSFVVETEKKMKEFTKKFESQFICPITQEVMKDPVILQESGHTFDKTAIERWIQQSSTCPITRTHLVTKKLIPNIALRSTITEWERQNKDWNEDEEKEKQKEEEERERERDEEIRKKNDIFWEDVFGDFSSNFSNEQPPPPPQRNPSSSSQTASGPPPPPLPPPETRRTIEDPFSDFFDDDNRSRRLRRRRRRGQEEEEEEEDNFDDLFGESDDDDTEVNEIPIPIPRRRITETQRQREMNERHKLRIFFRDFQNMNNNNNNTSSRRGRGRGRTGKRVTGSNNNNNNGLNWLDEIFQEEGRTLGNPAEGGSPIVGFNSPPPPPPPPLPLPPPSSSNGHNNNNENNMITSSSSQQENGNTGGVSLPPFPGTSVLGNNSSSTTTTGNNNNNNEEEEEEMSRNREERRFESSLQILREMGFSNIDERAANLLRQNNGNLERVVNMIIGSDFEHNDSSEKII